MLKEKFKNTFEISQIILLFGTHFLENSLIWCLALFLADFSDLFLIIPSPSPLYNLSLLSIKLLLYLI